MERTVCLLVDANATLDLDAQTRVRRLSPFFEADERVVVHPLAVESVPRHQTAYFVVGGPGRSVRALEQLGEQLVRTVNTPDVNMARLGEDGRLYWLAHDREREAPLAPVRFVAVRQRVSGGAPRQYVTADPSPFLQATLDEWMDALFPVEMMNAASLSEEMHQHLLGRLAQAHQRANEYGGVRVAFYERGDVRQVEWRAPLFAKYAYVLFAARRVPDTDDFEWEAGAALYETVHTRPDSACGFAEAQLRQPLYWVQSWQQSDAAVAVLYTDGLLQSAGASVERSVVESNALNETLSEALCPAQSGRSE